MLFVDDRFPAFVDLVQPANDFPASGVAMAIQQGPQRSFLNFDARESNAGMRMPTAASFLVCVSNRSVVSRPWLTGTLLAALGRDFFLGGSGSRSAGESRTGAAIARLNVACSWQRQTSVGANRSRSCLQDGATVVRQWVLDFPVVTSETEG